MIRIPVPICLFLSVLFFAGCGGGSQEEQKSPRPTAVELAPVTSRDLPEIVQGVGTLEAPQNVQVAAESAGRIEGIHFQQGEPVEKGELLFTIRAEKVRQSLEAQKASLAEARAELRNARRIFRRREELLEENLVSREARDEARTDVETAQARVERIQAEIGRIQEELADTRVSAPISGVTGERQVDIGDYVSVGNPLVSIVETRQLEVEFSVPERYLGQVGTGQPVTLRSPAYPERTFRGEVSFVSPRIRESTRDLLLKADIENPDFLLRPGGFAAVEVTVDTHEGALIIPEEALVPTRTGYIVFVVEDGKANRREVEIGLRRPGIVEIRQGLSADEMVIRRGHMQVGDGDPVRRIEKNGEENGEPTE